MMSQNPVTFVDSFVSDLSPLNQVPVLTRIGMTLINARYRVWWFMSKKKLYTNSNNWAALGLGTLSLAVTKATVSNNPVLQNAVKILHITTRVLRCSKQIYKTSISCLALTDAMRGRYQLPKKPVWVKTKSIVTPQTRNSFNLRRMKIASQSRKIAACAWAFLGRLDILSMHFIDTYKAFYSKDEAMIESMLNIAEIYKKVTQNKVVIDLKNKIIEKMQVLDQKHEVMKAAEMFIEDPKKLIESYQGMKEKVEVIVGEVQKAKNFVTKQACNLFAIAKSNWTTLKDGFKPILFHVKLIEPPKEEKPKFISLQRTDGDKIILYIPTTFKK